MVMALLTIALVLFTGGHHTSEAELDVKIARVKTTSPAAISSRTSDMPFRATQHVPTLTPYKIQSGDTLFAIAERYHTQIADIEKQNPQVKPETLTVGQTLRVPINTVKKQKSRAELAELASKTAISASGKPIRYIKRIPCILTAYSNSFESTGKNPGDSGYGITATGVIAKEGWTVAVDPAIFPLHSVLYIPGVGFRFAEDTGGAVKGSHVDVFYGDDQYCRKFGVKGPVEVYMIAEGDGRESS